MLFLRLDIINNGTASGSYAQLYQCGSNSPNQKFVYNTAAKTFTKYSHEISVPCTNFLYSPQSSKVLEAVPNFGTGPGNRIWLQ